MKACCVGADVAGEGVGDGAVTAVGVDTRTGVHKELGTCLSVAALAGEGGRGGRGAPDAVILKDTGPELGVGAAATTGPVEGPACEGACVVAAVCRCV